MSRRDFVTHLDVVGKVKYRDELTILDSHPNSRFWEHKIQMLSMSFNYYQEVDAELARELIVFAINLHLSDINKNQEIKPYLSNYPFTAKNIEVMIFVYGSDRLALPSEKLYCLTSRNGILSYYTRLDRDNPVCKETYKEALRIVKDSQKTPTSEK